LLNDFGEQKLAGSRNCKQSVAANAIFGIADANPETNSKTAKIKKVILLNIILIFGDVLLRNITEIW